jgi:hypothetical protein
MEQKYTWTEINEMNVDTLRRMVVDLGRENPEFIGMSKKQKPFLIQALWNYFMSTGQASFDDASDENEDFSDFDDFSDFSDLDAEEESMEDEAMEDDWAVDDTPNGFADAMNNPFKKESKKLDTNIGHLLFNGMVSNGPTVSNVTVTISAGSMSNNYPVVGKSIYEVEKMLGQVLNVNPYARIVLVNGDEVTNDYIIQERDVVEFVNEAYDKG